MGVTDLGNALVWPAVQCHRLINHLPGNGIHAFSDFFQIRIRCGLISLAETRLGADRAKVVHNTRLDLLAYLGICVCDVQRKEDCCVGRILMPSLLKGLMIASQMTGQLW